MNQQEQFAKDKYLVLKDFWDVSLLEKELKSFYRPEFLSEYSIEPSQTYEAVQISNTPEVLMAQLEMRETLQEIVGERIAPSYNFSRVYKTGSGLEAHLDRPSCDISITLHVFGDEPWEIGVTMDDGEQRGYDLKPGDALLYKGCERVHWRKGLYSGRCYGQCFIHYVRLVDGYVNHIFDIPQHRSEGYQRALADIGQSLEQIQRDRGLL